MNFNGTTNDPVTDIIYKLFGDHLPGCFFTTETRSAWSNTEKLPLFSLNLCDLYASVVSFTTEKRSTPEKHRELRDAP